MDNSQEQNIMPPSQTAPYNTILIAGCKSQISKASGRMSLSLSVHVLYWYDVFTTGYGLHCSVNIDICRTSVERIKRMNLSAIRRMPGHFSGTFQANAFVIDIIAEAFIFTKRKT